LTSTFEIPRILISSLVSFLTTFYLLRFWIVAAKRRGLVGKDMNKPERPEVAEAGGIWALIGTSFGLLVYEALYIYINGAYYRVAELFSLVLVLLLSGFLGFIDDIMGWKKGIPPIARILFLFPIALPLVVIKAGVSSMELPLVGTVNFGVLYPLVIVPIGILGAANATNMIAGYNGLEAGMIALLLAFTSIYAYAKSLELTLLASLVGITAVVAFLFYNRYPARVFPGNAFTYGMGAYYASLVILDDFQKFGVSLFSLYFVELALFIRGLKDGVYKENFAKVGEDGLLYPPYEKSYSLTHFMIKAINRLTGRGAREVEVVLGLLLLQALVGALSLYFFLW
jgi:UDP-N-acetylglucosamine--dolichyl-phosphate N-acetylglucosaminephosphotransferase